MTEANFGRAHNITVRKTKTPEEASRTIAHELTHAAQYEACGTWTHTVKEHRRQMRIPYARRPWEVEARGNEHLGDVFHPARPVSDV